MSLNLLPDFKKALVEFDDRTVLDRFYYSRPAIMLADNQEAELRRAVSNKFGVAMRDVKSRAWRKVDFYNLAAEVDRQLFSLKQRPDPSEAAKALTQFYNRVESARHEPPADDNVKRYFEATLQNTNDRAQRIIRGEVIRGILESVPHAQFEIEVPKEEPHLIDLAEIEEEADAEEVSETLVGLPAEREKEAPEPAPSRDPFALDE